MPQKKDFSKDKTYQFQPEDYVIVDVLPVN